MQKGVQKPNIKHKFVADKKKRVSAKRTEKKVANIEKKNMKTCIQHI